MGKLTKAQREVLRLCDNSLGFIADDMSGPERRTTLRLIDRGLLSSPGGKRAFITPEGRAALASEEPRS